MNNNKNKSLKLVEQLTGGPLSLGSLIEGIRLADGMSQIDFAKRLKISPSHLCDIEKGREVVSPERAIKFAQILRYSKEQFVKLALQEILDIAGIKLTVDVKAI